jgi:hypothetical protein
MLHRIEQRAEISVARACGFAALAIALIFIGTMPAGLSLAFKFAGSGALLTCLVLLLKAWRADRRPYRRTEVWAMLSADERPSPDVAQRVIGTILRVLFLRFAKQAAIVATVMFALSLLSGGFISS